MCTLVAAMGEMVVATSNSVCANIEDTQTYIHLHVCMYKHIPTHNHTHTPHITPVHTHAFNCPPVNPVLTSR